MVDVNKKIVFEFCSNIDTAVKMLTVFQNYV